MWHTQFLAVSLLLDLRHFIIIAPLLTILDILKDSKDEFTGNVMEVHILEHCTAKFAKQQLFHYFVWKFDSVTLVLSFWIHSTHTMYKSCFSVQITKDAAIQDFINSRMYNAQ